MSRIGKRAIAVPSGVTANVEGQTVKIKGPKGALQVALHDDVSVKLESGQIKIAPRAETKRARAQWGTSRTLVNNLISGVTKGFEQRLEHFVDRFADKGRGIVSDGVTESQRKAPGQLAHLRLDPVGSVQGV